MERHQFNKEFQMKKAILGLCLAASMFSFGASAKAALECAKMSNGNGWICVNDAGEIIIITWR